MLQHELNMDFNYVPITYGEIKEGQGDPIPQNTQKYKMVKQATPDDLAVCDVLVRMGQKKRCFNAKIAWEDKVLQSLTAKFDYTRGTEVEKLSKLDIIHAQTFPEDYDFMCGSCTGVCYICGMSVPPVMIKRIVTRLIESGVFG
jgi:DNA (cytosine-5)-methyltransferase 1